MHDIIYEIHSSLISLFKFIGLFYTINDQKFKRIILKMLLARKFDIKLESSTESDYLAFA